MASVLDRTTKVPPGMPKTRSGIPLTSWALFAIVAFFIALAIWSQV
jgi:hypothetical protein